MSVVEGNHDHTDTILTLRDACNFPPSGNESHELIPADRLWYTHIFGLQSDDSSHSCGMVRCPT